MSSGNGPRYAPDDPTLPKPWRGLIDGKTGYLYFWNPETNVTQYERPAAKSSSGVPPPPRSSAVSANASAHGHRSSSDHNHRRDSRDEGRYDGSRSHHDQTSRGNSSQPQSLPNGSAAVYGAPHTSDQGFNSVSSRSSSRPVSSAVGGSLSVESYRRQHEITVMGTDVPAPFMTFESTGFSSEILKEVRHAGFSAPTPIQAQSWPIALQNRDVVAVAKTGSGKTCGYLFPGFILLNRLRNNSRNGPTVLVLAPTRELATQILDEAVKFGRSSRLSCTCLYGGAPKGPQLRDIERGVDIVVATPGRLNDILEMRKISLRQVSYLVLDEADRMLDMGFEPQIRKIVKEIPTKRQTLMFTATWPKEVRRIAADLLVNPVQVNIGNVDELVANKSITQYVEVITSMEKQRRLEQILRSQEPGSKILIFCSTKRMCDQLSRSLSRQFGAAVIHGDKTQSERDHVLSQFRTGRCPILVATDVAARGLDIKDIRVVINYDFPTGVEDYVHRIGRTGRAGATGVAYTFFSDQDAKHASDLIKVLEGACQRVPAELRDMGLSRGGGRGKFRRWGTGSGGRESNRSYGGRFDSDYGRSAVGSLPSGRLDAGHGARDQDHNDRFGRSFHDSFMEDSKSHVDTKTTWGNSETGMGERGSRRSRSRSRSPIVRQNHAVRDNFSSQRPSRSRSRSRSRNRGGSTIRDRSRSRSLDHTTRYGGNGSTHGWSSPKGGLSSRAVRTTPPIGSPRHDHKQAQSSIPSDRQGYEKKQPSPPYKKQDYQQERSPAPNEGRANYDTKRKRSSSPYMDKDYDEKQKRSMSPDNQQEQHAKLQRRSPSPYGAQAHGRQERSPSPYGRNESHKDKRSPSPYRGEDHYGKQSPLPYDERRDKDQSPHDEPKLSAPLHGNNLSERSPYSHSPTSRQDGGHASPVKEIDNGWLQPQKAADGEQLGHLTQGVALDGEISKHSMRSELNPREEEEEGMIPVEDDGVPSDAGWADRS